MTWRSEIRTSTKKLSWVENAARASGYRREIGAAEMVTMADLESVQ
jgi:hypothetical protein